MNNIATKRTVLSLWIAGGLVLLLSIGVALAAGETISHSLVGSAGGRISGGGLILHNAVGQPTAGTVENGISLCSGYLCGSRGDTASLTVEGTTPFDGAVDVPRNTPIVVDFSEAMDTGSVSVLIAPTVTTVITGSSTFLTLVVTTDGAYSGSLTNNVSVVPDGDVVDLNPANDGDEMTVTIQRDDGYSVYLPLVQRQQTEYLIKESRVSSLDACHLSERRRRRIGFASPNCQVER